MKVLFAPEVRTYFKALAIVLYKKYYFSYLESSQSYVERLVKDIQLNLPSQPKKLAPRYFERYGKELFYATFRVNKHTHRYVFFNVYQKENGTIFLVKYISNNHVIAQYL